MTFQKELCVVCERPTADGAVLAVHVDKEKLQTSFLNVCGHEFVEEIEDHDLICYFCTWDAEFLWKFDRMADDALVWWPARNSDHLDDAEKELRKNYFEGKLEPCWVQLEKIESNSEREENDSPIEAIIRPNVCIYCRKRFKYSRNLAGHIKNMHNDAIRCRNRKCSTYFHTLEEKEEHTKNVHESSRQRDKVECSFCGKKFEGSNNYNKHVQRVHKEFPVKCSSYGCLSFFRNEMEMETHFGSAHKSENEAKRFQCNDCGYRATFKYSLKEHIISKHIPKSSVCHICGHSFSSDCSLRYHIRRLHTFKVCFLCKLSVSVKSFNQSGHFSVKNCLRCKNKFQCSGLYQLHLKSCKETLFKCDKCQKTFMHISLMKYHTKREHRTRGIQHKQFGFKCEPCKKCYKSEKWLKTHLNRIHNKANLKFCAHCPKSFSNITNLKHHISVNHKI